MLCQKCLKNEATVKVVQIVNGKKKELSLCQSCAIEMGFEKAAKELQLPQLFGSLVLDILKKETDTAPPVSKRQTGSLKCPYCGTTWEDFKRTGLLGCDKCYDAFHDEIKKVLKQIHGNARHIGSRPSSVKTPVVQNLAKLRQELKKAVENEEYEKAARLRDQIRELQNQVKED